LAVRDGLAFVIAYLWRPADFQQVSLDPKRLVYAKPPVTGTVRMPIKPRAPGWWVGWLSNPDMEAKLVACRRKFV
jgi:hypothetical protein